jgi:hypothetical protein
MHHEPESVKGVWEESGEKNILRCDAGEREKINKSNSTACWDVTSYSSVEFHQCFGRIYCLHLQGKD